MEENLDGEEKVATGNTQKYRVPKYNQYHNLKKECFECWVFREENPKGYDCAYKGYCPGLDVSEKNKEKMQKLKDKYLERIKFRDENKGLDIKEKNRNERKNGMGDTKRP